jgi:hypothetical protein
LAFRTPLTMIAEAYRLTVINLNSPTFRSTLLPLGAPGLRATQTLPQKSLNLDLSQGSFTQLIDRTGGNVEMPSALQGVVQVIGMMMSLIISLLQRQTSNQANNLEEKVAGSSLSGSDRQDKIQSLLLLKEEAMRQAGKREDKPEKREGSELQGNNLVTVTNVLKNLDKNKEFLTEEQVTQIKKYADEHKDNPDALVQLNADKQLSFFDKRSFEEYKGIKIDVTNLDKSGGVTSKQIQRMKDTIDVLDKDSDGKKLLDNWVKQGGVFVNEERRGAGATDGVLANPELGDTVQTMGHELTHGVPDQGAGDHSSSEEIPTLMGMMIRYRQTGAFQYQDNFTKETKTFNGTKEDIQSKYNGLMKLHYRDEPDDYEKFKNGEANFTAPRLIKALKKMGIDSLDSLNIFDEPAYHEVAPK